MMPQSKINHINKFYLSLLILLHTVWNLVNIGKAVNITLVNGRPLQHLTIDNSNGEVYVGGVNRIYRLDSNLTLRQAEDTGPVQDSPNCITPVDLARCPSASLTDNYNKILLVYPTRGKLIQCGSIYQGACYMHPLNDITIKTTHLDENLAANTEQDSSVGFIARGPTSMGSPDIFYIGSSFVNYQDSAAKTIREKVPAVSSRKLRQDEEFKFMSEDSLTGRGSFIRFNNAERNPTTQYVSGFNQDNYAYFLFVQKETIYHHVSKILQLCKNDKTYNSYIEMSLKCTKNLVDYPFIQSAILSKPGSQLANSLSARTNEYLIFSLFSKTTDAYSDSALCIYKMTDIRTKFQENLQQCSSGKGYLVGTLKGVKGTTCSSGVSLIFSFLTFNFKFKTKLSLFSYIKFQ